MKTNMAKKFQDQFVRGKSFEEYYKEAESVYHEAEEKVKQLLKDSADMIETGKGPSGTGS